MFFWSDICKTTQEKPSKLGRVSLLGELESLNIKAPINALFWLISWIPGKGQYKFNTFFNSQFSADSNLIPSNIKSRQKCSIFSYISNVQQKCVMFVQNLA